MLVATIIESSVVVGVVLGIAGSNHDGYTTSTSTSMSTRKMTAANSCDGLVGHQG